MTTDMLLGFGAGVVAVSALVAVAIVVGVCRKDNRPRLQPGEVVTFYDSTGLIPQARLVVWQYTVSREGREMLLKGQEELLADVRMYPPPNPGRSAGYP